MSTGITCEVTVDGVVMQDGCGPEDALAPTVLSGLVVEWGRDTTMDQPAASTCSFEVSDPTGAPPFTDLLRIGAPVSVSASGVTYPDPTESTFVDPGFDTGVGGRRGINATAAIVPTSAGTVTRRNVVTHPRVTAFVSSPTSAIGINSGRWFGGGTSAGSYTLVSDASDGPEGITTYGRKTWTAIGGGQADTGWTTTYWDGYTPGAIYTASVWVRASVSRNYTPEVQFVDLASGSLIAERYVAPVVSGVPAGAWTRLVVAFPAPPVAGYRVVIFWDTDSGTAWAVGSTLDITGFLLEPVGTQDPTVLRRNLARNPSLEFGVTGWQANASATIARTNAQAHHGTYALGVTTTGLSGQGASQPLTTGVDPVPTSGSVTGSAWVWAPAGMPLTFYVSEFTPGSVLVGNGTAHNLTGTGAWVKVTSTRAGATAGNYVRAQVLTNAAHTAGTFYLDELLIETGATAGTYFDGSTVGTVLDYSWTGLAGQSASIIRAAAVPALGSYFDGATPDTPTTDYAWTGSPNGSPSTASTWPVDAHLRADPIDPTRRAGVQLAPDAFVPLNTSPTAWDDIPTTSPGQLWAFGAEVWAPAGATVEVRPVLYSGPWAQAATVVDEPLTFAGTGSWATVEGTFVPSVAGAWIGLEVSTFPTGRRWVDVPGETRWVDVPGTVAWRDTATILVDDVRVLAPLGGTARTVLAFAGRITDLEAVASDDGALVRVTAVDFTADLENRDVGGDDETWPAETMGARFSRVLTAAGLPITADIDPTVGGYVVSWQDVDSAAALGLLRDLATTTDAVLWPAFHAASGAYFHVEDAGQRSPLLRLEENVDGVVVIVMAGGRELHACAVEREPVTFLQSVADVATRVSLGWLAQGVDGEGEPTTESRNVQVIDPDLEAIMGTRRVSVSTLLTTETDATTVAERVMARASATDWRLSGVTVDDADIDDADLMLTLVDGTSRIGLPVTLTGLPEWSPVPGAIPIYVEGGALAFTDGRWLVEMNVSRGVGLGVSVTWAELDPSWRWVDVDPSIRWLDVLGVAGPNTPEEVTSHA